nr:unnamed protein product [Digitaria exilis]
MAKAVEVVELAGPEPAMVLALVSASVMPRPMMAAPKLQTADMRMVVGPVEETEFGKAMTSMRLAMELVAHPVQAMVTQVAQAPMGPQTQMEMEGEAALVEATVMVADLVVARELGKVRAITMATMARAMRTVVAMEAEAEVVGGFGGGSGGGSGNSGGAVSGYDDETWSVRISSPRKESEARTLHEILFEMCSSISAKQKIKNSYLLVLVCSRARTHGSCILERLARFAALREEGQGEGPQMAMVLDPVLVTDHPALVMLQVASMVLVIQWQGVKVVVAAVVIMEAMELVLDLLQDTAALLASMVVELQALGVVAVAVGKGEVVVAQLEVVMVVMALAMEVHLALALARASKTPTVGMPCRGHPGIFCETMALQPGVIFPASMKSYPIDISF